MRIPSPEGGLLGDVRSLGEKPVSKELSCNKLARQALEAAVRNVVPPSRFKTESEDIELISDCRAERR